MWIEAFLAVVDRGGFSAAAGHLYRSQGRVSSYITALERELGVRLFDRHQRPTRLTSEGEAFLPHARALLDELAAGRHAALEVKGLARGDVAVATYPSAGSEYLPHVLKNFARDYQNIEVKLVERRIRGLDQVLDSDEASIAIRPTVPPPMCRTPLHAQPLWREPMCLVVAEDHALSRSGAVEAVDLADQPLIIGGRNSEDAEITRLLSAVGVTPRIKYISNQPQSIVAMAREGLACGIINLMALRSVRLDGVAVVPVASGISREVAVYWTAAVEPSAAATALLRTVLLTPPPQQVVDLRGAAHRRHPTVFPPL